MTCGKITPPKIPENKPPLVDRPRLMATVCRKMIQKVLLVSASKVLEPLETFRSNSTFQKPRFAMWKFQVFVCFFFPAWDFSCCFNGRQGNYHPKNSKIIKRQRQFFLQKKSFKFQMFFFLQKYELQAYIPTIFCHCWLEPPAGDQTQNRWQQKWSHTDVLGQTYHDKMPMFYLLYPPTVQLEISFRTN